MEDRDLHELLAELRVDRASKVMVLAAPPEWVEVSEYTEYPCAADTGSFQLAITQREADALLAAGAASGENQPYSGP